MRRYYKPDMRISIVDEDDVVCASTIEWGEGEQGGDSEDWDNGEWGEGEW